MSPVSPQLGNQTPDRAGSLRHWPAVLFKQTSLEPLASLATIAGTVVSVLALIQSRAWLVLTSFFFVCISIGTLLYARNARLALNAASTVIEGHSIDSLNVANLRRRVNRTFVIQEAHDTVRIKDDDMEVTWKYSGYCKKDDVSTMEFSIDSDESTPFDQLACEAFDLAHDPNMTHKIRPILVGTEGISKKISVPFLKPIKADEYFSILLRCTLPRCLKPGFGYFTSSLSFAQSQVRRSSVHLTFLGALPSWLRVYKSTLKRPPELLKTLAPSRQEPTLCEYLDVVEDRPGQSARIYVFWRDP